MILAIDIEVEKRERFHSTRIIQVPIQEVIRNPKGVFEKIQPWP